MTLNEVQPGLTYEIVEIPFCEPCEEKHENSICWVNRLTELGIVPGESIRVLQILGDNVKVELSLYQEFVISKKMCKQIIIKQHE